MKTKPTTTAAAIISLFVVVIMLSSTSQAKVLYGVSVGGNRDYPGGNYAEFRAHSLDECVMTCSDDGRCAAFAYHPPSRTCWLKDRISEPVRSPGMKSGRKLSVGGHNSHPGRHISPPPSQTAPDMEIMYETDLPGSDYHHLPANNERECSKVCMGDRNCRAFTYNRVSHRCFLKRSHPRPVYNGEAVSGIRH